MSNKKRVCHRMSVKLDDGRHLDINITEEGIIMDVFLRGFTPDTDTHLGTVSMTFNEWADDIAEGEQQ
jgi:hypothetical protein